MTRCIVLAVVTGILAGYFIMPDGFIAVSGNLIVIGLCILLFFVGVDLGRTGTIGRNMKKLGYRVLVLPIAAIVGTLAMAALTSLFLPLSLNESLAVGSGFGWYSLAPAIIMNHSVEVSAISFMHNVMRELFAIVLIPVTAKMLGGIEAASLPGAAAMDVCLPVVEKAAGPNMAVYSFISGTIMSVAVPVLVPFFIGL